MSNFHKRHIHINMLMLIHINRDTDIHIQSVTHPNIQRHTHTNIHLTNIHAHKEIPTHIYT